MPPKQQPRKTAASSGAKATARGASTASVGVKGGATASGKKPNPAVSTGRQPAGPAGRGRAKPGQPPGKFAGKTGTVSAGKGPGKDVAVSKKPVWTKQDTMARKIQTFYRGYRCRKLLYELRKKKEDYDNLMQKLEREAFLQMVKMERMRAEAEMKREEEERRKKREHNRRVKRVLEAAFDGDIDEIKTVLKEVAQLYQEAGDMMVARQQHKMLECADPNNNTPISEAGAGGHPDMVKLLCSMGVDVNTVGQYGRTPLYRAAFGGHTDATRVLLEHGADPRIYAEDGATPEQVAARPEVEDLLKAWDIAETERLLVSLEKEKEKRKEMESHLWKNEESKMQSEISEAEKEHSIRQKELVKAYEELNKRIEEHDTNVTIKKEITLQIIHDAEDHLELCKLNAEKARERLMEVRLKMRMKRKEFHAGSEEDEDEVKVDAIANIKELDEVLMKDVGNKIAQSGKWPLIIDPGKQCATFLRYRDTNYLSAIRPRDMEAETIRLALLGAIRYGKFLVLDLLDVGGILPAVVQKFDQVQSNLLPALLSKEFFDKEKYLQLIKKADGEEYSQSQFASARVHNFKLVIITQLFSPPEELLRQCYVIKIHTPTSSGP